MKLAADFRYIAREALRGKWGIAVIAGLIASLLGALGSEGPEVKLNVDMSEGANVSFEYAGQTILSTSGGINDQLSAVLIGSAIYIAIAAILLAAVYFVLGSVIEADHPELTASEAIERSKEMMSGNRFRLFCLHLSFIGWAILCAFTFGIGNLWLTPYRQATVSAFYREVSGTEQTVGEEYSYETL